jgi:hypothetical protein
MEMISAQDIFRKYPATYEGVIPTLCSNLDELDEPEAKASLIWIIGEYAKKINNADELLGIFVDSFTEESYPVSGGNNSFIQVDDLISVGSGSTANADCSGQTLLKQARHVSRHRPARTQYRHKRL